MHVERSYRLWDGDVISDADIREAFACLLGRAPGAAEAATLRARFSAPGRDERAELHESLIRSEEFRNRRVGAYRWAKFEPLQLDRPRIAFVHIEKCGGTTMRAMLEQLFDPTSICPERLDGLGNWTINELAAYDLFAGHFDLPVCRSIPGDVRVFTMLREPKARLVSLFRFWKAHRPDPERDNHVLMELARTLDAEAFFSHPRVVSHPSIRDAMAGQLIRTEAKHAVTPGNVLLSDPAAALARAWGALQGLAAFGLLERFEESVVAINAALGVSLRSTRPRQVLTDLARTSPELDLPPALPMTRRLDALLDGLTAVDRALYDRAGRLFDQRVPGRPGMVARLARLGRPG